MGGPSDHGQKNKAHKVGRHASKGARHKHKEQKEGLRRVSQTKARQVLSKEQRVAASANKRAAARAALLEERRNRVAPKVVALLQLSEDVDVASLWSDLLSACRTMSPSGAQVSTKGDKASGMEVDAEVSPGSQPLAMTTVCVGKGSKQRLTLLPPLSNRADPLAVVDMARAAEVVLLAMPGSSGSSCIDDEGHMALAVLRALGLPSAFGVVRTAGQSQDAAPSMKERSAAKQRAASALQDQIGSDHKVLHCDSAQDMSHMLRLLSEHTPSVPKWRQQRPSVMVHDVSYIAQQQADPALGTLLVRGFVRAVGLSANQLLHIPGCGDFQISRIESGPDPLPGGSRPPRGTEMDTEGTGVASIVEPDPEARDDLIRENAVDPLAGEQTWPTQEEMMEAELAYAAHAKKVKKKVPKGTSEYQAAWILDDDGDVGDDDDGNDSDDDDDDDDEAPGAVAMTALDDFPDNRSDFPLGEGDTDTDMMQDDESDATEDVRQWQAAKKRRAAEHEDEQFPDEVDTPAEVEARIRFGKYRGLKSWRSSPWDPKESLPPDYARVFAFENFKRAHKRAREAALKAGSLQDVCGVSAGCWVCVHVEGVSAQQAQQVQQRVDAAAQGGAVPLVVTGLLQHESKLSVVHMAVQKSAAYEQPVAGKDNLLLVMGTRSFFGRPVFSTDDIHLDKHKMERFLHPGRQCVASVYAPIAYPPLPVLAFKCEEGLTPQLVFTGCVRGCDPDRVVLKKMVLSGYPVRVHKTKAIVKYMFHNPADVRWFKPVDLWTKRGRRGRIKEAVGTHGIMKCLFDGVISQQDTVCMSLYKRVFPKWPQDLTFA